ncbi:MAG TPA: AbrB/MazE/SpoVT family DNA-binding domain-containing protein [Armatimonadota bacterium]|nr:AbrB/MazE/SpoVT family DNA-binding domain-containing protein [Armatimonadota bacterium]
MSQDVPTIEEFFYGSATIGERGQIVIPADARKDCNIHSGDKLLVFRHPMQKNLLLLARVADMQQIYQQMSKSLEIVGTTLAAAEADTKE